VIYHLSKIKILGCNSIPLRNILEEIFTSTVAIWLKANRIEERLEKRRKEGWCRHRRRMLVS
jgi:hypothetical protein